MASNRRGGLDFGGLGKSKVHISGGSKTRPGLTFSKNVGAGRGVAPTAKPQDPNSFGGSLFNEDNKPAQHRRNRVLLVLGIALALVLVVGAGVVAYMQSAQNAMKPSLTLSSSTLSQVSQDQTLVWSLYTQTDQNESSSADLSVSNAALLGFDMQNERISVIWLPSDLRLYVAGYGYQSLSEVYGANDDDSYIAAIEGATSLEISHYFKSSTPGMKRLAESLEFDSSAQKEQYASLLAKALLESSSDQLSSDVSIVETLVASDFSSADLTSFLEQFRGMEVDKALECVDVPLDTDKTEEDTEQIKASSLATMVKRISNGLAPTATKSEVNSTNEIRSGTRITIWNGVGVSGIASDCSSYLEEKGWQIESTGNAASFVYDETLVIYKYDSDKKIADLLVSDLGQGKAYSSGWKYNYDGDILLVIGKDYQPF